MEFEAWFLLVIPLFFALGWVAARVLVRARVFGAGFRWGFAVGAALGRTGDLR